MDRMDRINQQLKREIGNIIHHGLGDPRLGFVSVTHVSVSRDLQNARVYFTVLGDAGRREAAQKGLESAAGMIRKLVGQGVKLRYTPEISFVYDKSIDLSARIEETLREIHDDETKEIPRDHPAA